MIQEFYQKAIKFAGEKHSNQKVPGSDANYLLHLSNVAMEVLVAYRQEQNFDLKFAIQLAILHDTIEDTETTFEELESIFGNQVANGVLALTKQNSFPTKKERMEDSLRRINKQNREVGIVKLADRITNLQKPPNHWTKEKISRYLLEAEQVSLSLTGKNEYLNRRLIQKIKEYEQFI